MKAIETVWKGYRFRSRTEARWAVFFDSLGVRFEYEPEGLELPSGRYLPDFALWFHGPDHGNSYPFSRGQTIRRIWFEVKGAPATAAELLACKELGDATNELVLLAIGPPDTTPQIHQCDGGDFGLFDPTRTSPGHFAASGDTEAICIAHIRTAPAPPVRGYGGPANEPLGFAAEAKSYPDYFWSDPTRISPALQRAYDAARSARFEFGQTDPRWPT